MKIIEKDNFIDVLEEGMEDDEYHAWRRVMDQYRTIDNKIKTDLISQDSRSGPKGSNH
jgi:hypothetical protein